VIVLDLEQGTPAWLAWRASKKMASEASALPRLSPWPPRTPFELWEVKSGRAEIRVTPAMARGVELEARARALYEISRSDPDDALCHRGRRRLCRLARRAVVTATGSWR
jgi:predicted phage-related endonuclease